MPSNVSHYVRSTSRLDTYRAGQLDLHAGTEARHLQRPDPQMPANTPPQACRALQSDGGEYGRGWTNHYRLQGALVVRTPSFAVAGARSPATPSFAWLWRFIDFPPRLRLSWSWV